MATINNGGHNFINLNGFAGTGEVGRYRDDVTGILVGIEPRGGSYTVRDRRTGEMITRPNSWTAVFEDGSMWSWPTYIDEKTNQVMPWSRFDPSINLALCVKQRKVIHVWKDDKSFSHLEVVETTSNINPLPVTNGDGIPWEG
jgi:hypothetical protein